MANKIVQLIDSNNDNIFPVAGGMAGDSITTGMLQDGAVTAGKVDDGAVTRAKFARYAVNEAVVTTGNLTPAEDMPKAWETTLGDIGHWITPYTVANSFTNQPSQYGILETIISTGGVYQRWTKAGSGEIYHRSGLGYSNTNHWWDSSSATGAFKQVMDDKSLTVIPNTSITFTNSSAVAAGTPFAFVVSKQGRNVFLQGKVDITGDVSAYSNFMSLPDSLCPITDITVAAGSKLVDIRYNGGVQCHSALTSGDSVMLAASYASK